MTKERNWFSVDTAGMKQLQLRKPKHYIIRELVANALDENITKCQVEIEWKNGIAYISVEDDNPEGFKNLTDAYTLFAPTEKIKNPKQRGRFNMGEKQAIAVCESAMIVTTKGSICFDKSGRHRKSTKTEKGSLIAVKVKMTKKEYEESLEIVKKYLIPKEIFFTINGDRIEYIKPIKTINASLLTEIEENQILKKVWRNTDIDIFKTNDPLLFEMGIPVMKIDCKYNIDVQQKIPLTIDRDSVPEKYLNNLYAEVLNKMYSDISIDESSQNWIRKATSDKRIQPDAVKTILHKRYGEKVIVANPFDPLSVDDAISAGYKVITGSELSKEEWENIRRDDLLKSSTDLFGKTWVDSITIKPNKEQEKIAEFAKKIAKRILKIDLKVNFYKSKATSGATFGNNTLSFNISRISNSFWENPIDKNVLSLILHELAHYKGHHTEMMYHQCLTEMSAELILIALEEPKFFE